MPPAPKLEDIKIPDLPDHAKFVLPNTTEAFMGRLQINGVWYELATMQIRRDDRLNDEVKAIAQQLVWVKYQELDQYRQLLDRTKRQLEQAQAALQIAADAPFPTQACAQAGLTVWKTGPGAYMLEKPLTYFLQHIVRYGKRHQILPGQFKPRMVMAQLTWMYPSGGLGGHKLLDMNTGNVFVHYHTIYGGTGDCTGDLPKICKDYPALLKMFAMWEQQLQTVTCEGQGEPPLHQPPEFPHIDQVKVVEQEVKNGGAWTTPKPSPVPSS